MIRVSVVAVAAEAETIEAGTIDGVAVIDVVNVTTINSVVATNNTIAETINHMVVKVTVKVRSKLLRPFYK